MLFYLSVAIGGVAAAVVVFVTVVFGGEWLLGRWFAREEAQARGRRAAEALAAANRALDAEDWDRAAARIDDAMANGADETAIQRAKERLGGRAHFIACATLIARDRRKRRPTDEGARHDLATPAAAPPSPSVLQPATANVGTATLEPSSGL